MQSNQTRPESLETSRRMWTAPELRRLVASEAEFGTGTTIDAEGFS